MKCRIIGSWMAIAGACVALLSGCGMMETKPPAPVPVKIGLALGGGAARGFAHIGVIKALEAQGIVPDIIVGTSAGAVVGSLYASGLSGFDLQKTTLDMTEKQVVGWAWPNRGWMDGEVLQTFINTAVGNRPLEALPRKIAIVATELKTGAPVLFSSGNTGVAVRASAAVPGVFQPVSIAGREYVDGGLVAPVPVRFAKQMGAELVIAVDISAAPEGNATGDAMRMLLQTFAIMGRSINNFELREADVVLRPSLPGVSGADFAARKRSIQAGREVALAQMAELRQRIAAKTR